MEIQRDKNRERGLVDYTSQVGLDMYDYLLSHAKTKRGFRYLDAGCGDGYAAEEAALLYKLSHIPASVYASDINFPGKLYNRVIRRIQDILQLDETEFYDLITASFVLPYLSDPLRAIENLYNALIPSGMLAATIFPESIRIDGIGLFEKDSPLVKAIEESGGDCEVLLLKGNPDNAHAIHIQRGQTPIDIKYSIIESRKPEKGYPMSVAYKTNEP